MDIIIDVLLLFGVVAILVSILGFAILHLSPRPFNPLTVTRASKRLAIGGLIGIISFILGQILENLPLFEVRGVVHNPRPDTMFLGSKDGKDEYNPCSKKELQIVRIVDKKDRNYGRLIPLVNPDNKCLCDGDGIDFKRKDGRLGDVAGIGGTKAPFAKFLELVTPKSTEERCQTE